MGTSLAIPIVLVVIIGLILGTLINFAFGFLAIPIVAFLMLNFMLASDTFQRQRRINKIKQFRNASSTRKVEFTEQDKRTVI